MVVFLLIGAAVMALAHLAPAPFVVDALAGDQAVWHMSRDDPPTVYLTYDDGPNPTTTPRLLDVLARERVRATFFLIDRHLREDTIDIVKRTFADGHAVAIHSADKSYMLLTPSALAERVMSAADHIETLAGTRPCRAFRPRAGWRGGSMYEGLKTIDYTLVGWGWMLWDVEIFRPRDAARTIKRLRGRISAGDIVVMHDGDDGAPTRDQRHTIEATTQLIPWLRERGFSFGTVCQNGG